MIGSEVLSAMGKPDDSIASYRETLRIDPSRNGTRGLLAKSLISQGRFEEAQTEAAQFLERHLADDPARPVAKAFLDHGALILELEAHLPAVLEGTRVPLSGVECLAFADLFRARHDDAAAARYFGEAMERGSGTPVSDRNWRTFDAAWSELSDAERERAHAVHVAASASGSRFDQVTVAFAPTSALAGPLGGP